MLLLTYSTAVICAVFIITGAVSGKEVKKAVGDEVSFRLDKLDPPVTSITWKHVSLSTVKAIEWDSEDGFIIPNQRFKDITTLDEKTGQITITNLKVEHSGNYTIDINSKEQGQRFSLEVMERVPKPKITVEKSSNPDDVVYLRCEYSGTIIWKNSAGETLKGNKNHKPGEFITVKNTRNPENYYTCTLKNAVSEKTSDRVSERDLFKTEEVPKPEITLEESSNPDTLNLVCEYDEKIIWKNSAGETLKGSKHRTKGESITVKNTRNPENYYTCTLKNAVSEKTSDRVYERDLFQTGEDVKKAVGETVSFRPDKLDSPVTSITWKHGSLTTVKAIEWDSEDGVIIPNQRFKDIATLDEKTGEITITNLKVEHSGNYTIDINSKEQGQRFSLEVIDRVPKPEITVEESSNPDVVYLICEYSGTIIWKNSTGETLKGNKNHKPGEFITVKNTRNPENYYTCTLKNAVSEKTSDPVSERDLFQTESSAGLIVGIVICVVLFIIIGLICAYLRSESIYNRVNECCPWIESVLRHVDCCAEKRKLTYTHTQTQMRKYLLNLYFHQSDSR